MVKSAVLKLKFESSVVCIFHVKNKAAGIKKNLKNRQKDI